MKKQIDIYIKFKLEVQSFDQETVFTSFPKFLKNLNFTNPSFKNIGSSHFDLGELLDIHYEMVQHLTRDLHQKGTFAAKVHEMGGHGELYGLAKHLALKFYDKYSDEIWDGNFFDQVDQFLNDKDNFLDYHLFKN